MIPTEINSCLGKKAKYYKPKSGSTKCRHIFYIGKEEGRYEDHCDQERQKEKPIAGKDTRII